MGMSYNRLWKLLKDRGLNKSALGKLAGLSSATVSKLSKGENVHTDILVRLCRVLQCELNDIAEVSPPESVQN